MNNNKQSSVEWLDKQLASLNFDYITGQVSNKEYNDKSKQILEQAKVMHKEEIIKSMIIAFRDGAKIAAIYYQSPYEDWEQYYNETFGG